MTTSTPLIGSFADIPLHGDRVGQPPTDAAVDKHVAAAAVGALVYARSAGLAYAGRH